MKIIYAIAIGAALSGCAIDPPNDGWKHHPATPGTAEYWVKAGALISHPSPSRYAVFVNGKEVIFSTLDTAKTSAQ